MKLFDYTNLLNIIKEVELENSKLKNLKEMTLKNKFLELELKLFNSGILEDWLRLNKLVTNRIFYNRWKDSYLESIYFNKKTFFEYQDNMFSVLVSSGSYWSDYLCIEPEHSINNGKIAWKIVSTTEQHFKGFRNNEEEYSLKILMIETLMNTYEDYRNFVLEDIAEKINNKINHNEKLKKEILELVY